MIAWRSLLLKEWRGQWSGPLNYILIGLFMLLMGSLFFQTLLSAKENGQAIQADAMARSLIGNLNSLLLFISALVSMRSISEEIRRGTLDLLFLGKLSAWQIWSSKFLSSLSVVATMLFLSLLFPLVIAQKAPLDWSTIASAHLGTLLNLGLYVAIGVFASSLTQQQILAAIMSFVGILMLLMLSWVAQNTNNVLLAQIFNYLSPSSHLQAFAFGQIRSFSFVYYLSGIFLFALMTVRSLELRRI